MKTRKTLVYSALICATMAVGAMASSCSGKSDKSTGELAKADSVATAPTEIDKSSDTVLTALIKDVAPKFTQLEYTDQATGAKMAYSLYVPQDAKPGKKYPLVMFIADASTAGKEATTSLTQGYGALVWATDSAQAQNPCYVLVPQFSEVAVNDDYKLTSEADIAISLLKQVVDNNSVDQTRVYATGQSMGGMLAMYYNVAYPKLFAASIFVDSHWDTATFDKLVKTKYIFFVAGDSGKAYKDIEPMQAAAQKENVQYTFTEWSARLPLAQQNGVAAAMLDKNAPVNIFQFEPGTVLPEGSTASEHMASFDFAYRLPAVKAWLFKQSL